MCVYIYIYIYINCYIYVCTNMDAQMNKCTAKAGRQVKHIYTIYMLAPPPKIHLFSNFL